MVDSTKEFFYVTKNGLFEYILVTSNITFVYLNFFDLNIYFSRQIEQKFYLNWNYNILILKFYWQIIFFLFIYVYHLFESDKFFLQIKYVNIFYNILKSRQFFENWTKKNVSINNMLLNKFSCLSQANSFFNLACLKCLFKKV